MTCDTGVLTFDIAVTAELYPQLTGVLAVFAFGVIIFILPGTYRREPLSRTSPVPGVSRTGRSSRQDSQRQWLAEPDQRYVYPERVSGMKSWRLSDKLLTKWPRYRRASVSYSKLMFIQELPAL
jgi:hypothetical protein